jgi:rare lipoprotein A
MQTAPVPAGGAILRRLRSRTTPRLLALLVAVTAAVPGVAVPGVHAFELFGKRIGQASWYGAEFARRRTASGEVFDPHKLTGAHRTLPFGSKVRVTNLHNGRSVLVTITDRGPFLRHREIDLSYGAARVLGMVERGVARVSIEPLES